MQEVIIIDSLSIKGSDTQILVWAEGMAGREEESMRRLRWEF